MPRGSCLLCQTESELRLSHVIPAFVYRWLRESSGNGHIRRSDEPNKRVQDGLKYYWLCPACEELFSHSEKRFADHLFHPYLTESGEVFPYSQWLLHFCTSVSWRVLWHFRSEGHLAKWKPEALAHVTKAEFEWKEYLLGYRANPGAFQQHILPLDQIVSANGTLRPNINRYLMRAIHMDMCHDSKAIFTYSKLGRFIILGFIHEPNISRWRGTKVHATHGFIEPKKYVLPREFLDYLNEKARNMHDAMGSVSDKQQKKIDAAFQANIERFSGSDALSAMQADVNLFGTDAVLKRKAPRGEES